MLQHRNRPGTSRTARLWRYIAAADKLVKERFDAKAEHLLARHLLQRRQLYAHAMGSGDFGTALRVLQDEAKLEGLYPPQKIAPTNPTGDQPYEPSTLSDLERAAALRNLYARLGTPGGSTPADRPDDGGGSLLGRPDGDPDPRGWPPIPGRRTFW